MTSKTAKTTCEYSYSTEVGLADVTGGSRIRIALPSGHFFVLEEKLANRRGLLTYLKRWAAST